MSKDQVYTAIILKKTPLNEADEIVTFYTKEQGKVRGLAKSVKLQKSKLQHSLQSLFLVRVSFAEKRRSLSQTALRKIIHCEIINSHINTRKFFAAAKAGLYALEVIFRSTPDEQKNIQIFNLLKNLLQFLNQKEHTESTIRMALVKFKLLFLKYLGHEVLLPEKNGNKLFFSNSYGGFGYDLNSEDRIKVSENMLSFPRFLLSSGIKETKTDVDLKAFSNLLDNFLEYQIERKINSKSF